MAPEREEDVKVVGRCGLVVWFFTGKKRWEFVQNVPKMDVVEVVF